MLDARNNDLESHTKVKKHNIYVVRLDLANTNGLIQ